MSLLRDVATHLLYQLEVGLILNEHHDSGAGQKINVTATTASTGNPNGIWGGILRGVPVSEKNLNLIPTKVA